MGPVPTQNFEEFLDKSGCIEKLQPNSKKEPPQKKDEPTFHFGSSIPFDLT